MPGRIRRSSTSTPRQEHRLMHSLRTARTGASLPTTGRRWQRTTSHGGSRGCPTWSSSSMPSGLTTFSDSSASGRFRQERRAVSPDISTLPTRSARMNSGREDSMSPLAGTRRIPSTPSSWRTRGAKDTGTRESRPRTRSATAICRNGRRMPTMPSTMISSTVATMNSGGSRQ